MYAAHFAAALAIKSRAPKAPAAVLIAGAFLPDICWIGLAAAGVEPTDPKLYFDDWSHSLATIVLQAAVIALILVRRGAGVWVPAGAAVFSHFLLDFPIHPRPLVLYPHSQVRLGWDLWHWGLSRSWLHATNYWWVQLAVTLVLLAVYVSGRSGLRSNLLAASCFTVLGLHLLMAG